MAWWNDNIGHVLEALDWVATKWIWNCMCRVFNRYLGRDPSGSTLCLTLVGYNFEKNAYRELLRQAHLHWFLYRVTLEIGHDWTSFSKETRLFLGFLRTFLASTCCLNVCMSIWLMNFALFWSKCCFQIPSPGVHEPLLHINCRTCTNE